MTNSPSWRRVRALIAALSWSGTLVLAPTIGVLAADPMDSDLVDRIQKEEQERKTGVVGLGRARLSLPQKVSGAVGAMFVRQPVGHDCRAVCEYRGFLVQAEPGIGGGQLTAGYAVINGERARNVPFLRHVYLGYGFKGALMRTWGDSSLDPDDQTLLGVEGDFTVIGINFSLGVLRHVGSGDPDQPWVVTGGVGWAF